MRLDHMYRLTDARGLYQHANGITPNPQFGYCLDDNIRALIVALRAMPFIRDSRLPAAAAVYLDFTERAQRPDGRFRNFMAANGDWLEDVGSEDANGRAVWGLAYALLAAPNVDTRRRALRLLNRALEAAASLTALRARAYLLIGLKHWMAVMPGDEARLVASRVADAIALQYRTAADGNWRWFEDRLTYCNACLPEALLGTAYHSLALEALDWLCQTMENSGVLSLVGNQGWYPKGGLPARFDQQPVDAAAISAACLEAYQRTSEPRFERWNRLAHAWFLGANVTEEVMVDPQSGGCYDGLTEAGHNANEGAESLLAWLSTCEDALAMRADN